MKAINLKKFVTLAKAGVQINLKWIPVFTGMTLLILILITSRLYSKPAPYEHPALEKGVECSTCHDDGRTRQTRPESHDIAWKKDHGKFIKKFGFKPDASCRLCHSESQCTSCHQQEKPRDHNEFWRLKGHGLAVGLDRSRCFTCHRGADFCERCHAQTTPLDHHAAWGAPANRHCLNCHFPISSAGAQKCGTCHRSTPSHNGTPRMPSNSLHVSGANCRGCHIPLHHPDNGMQCTGCHTR